MKTIKQIAADIRARISGERERVTVKAVKHAVPQQHATYEVRQ